MADLRSPRLIYLKAVLFVWLGIMASALLLWEHPSLKVAVLLALAVWAFARAYYFAFYVVEHYIDGQYRFAGLWAFFKYIWQRRQAGRQGNDSPGASA